MNDEQYSKLPNIFQEIIRFDKRAETFLSGGVVSFKEYINLRKERNDLATGAWNFLRRQGGGGGFLG